MERNRFFTRLCSKDILQMKVFMTGCFLFPNKQNKTKLVSLVGIVLVIHGSCPYDNDIFFSLKHIFLYVFKVLFGIKYKLQQFT